ncbi:MAG: PTS sugar transporter subunit IIB [Chloroflexota bacterium]|nr:MAG: PTS sugar transporter subunit IIB [Chloroflexota bacterium]
MDERKTIKALMVCAMGMSSSLLEAKTREAAQAAGVPFDLHAIATAEIATWNFAANYVDIVLIAPQVRYKRKSITEAAAPYNIIVADIDPVSFGMVEGEKLFKQIMAAIEARDNAIKA